MSANPGVVDPFVHGCYWQVALVIAAELAAVARETLRDLGALGVHDEPVAGARCSLRGLFAATEERDALSARVGAALAARGVALASRLRIAEIRPDEWAEAWPEYFVPVAVGRRVLIVPSWFFDPVRTDRAVIAIDPGAGFGTGHHPTTAGCLRALERLAEPQAAAHVLDLGTGSGILAIAAARLGAARVTAVDDDPAAIACAAANAARNAVTAEVRYVLGDARTLPLEPATLVVANLLTPTHRALAARYGRLVVGGGALVLGGILPEEAAEITALLAGDFPRREPWTDAGWTTLVARRAG